MILKPEVVKLHNTLKKYKNQKKRKKQKEFN